MLHKNIPLGDIHYIHNWEVANAAALAALVVTAADKGKLAWQTDTNAFYFLANNVGPVWIGALGVAGPAGPTGPGLLSGIIAPTSEGVEGDFYLNTVTSMIYGPKGPLSWPAGVSLIGPPGPTGSTGPTGPTGSTGSTGATGATGPGVPIGGAAGTVLTKVSSTDNDTTWAASSGAGTTVSATAPSTPSNGQGWLDSNTGILYIWVDDGDSSAWVSTSEEGNAIGAVVTASTPSTAPVGFLWFDTNTGTTYINIGTSAAPVWVEGGPVAPKPAGREILTADRTYYIATTGNDSNDGLTIGTPFLTIQKAIDLISSTLDISGKVVTIQVADGTYTTPIMLAQVVGYKAPGNLVIKGNLSTPANVIISTTSADAITADGIQSVWDIKDLKVQTTTSGHGLLATRTSYVRWGNLVFGACAQNHILSVDGSYAVALSSYSITGGALQHARASVTSCLRISAITITITGTPNFTQAFLVGEYASTFIATSNTYVGSATGTKYTTSFNGILQTAGAALPGSVAGSSTTGGQYA